jgi:hypothetical protein
MRREASRVSFLNAGRGGRSAMALMSLAGHSAFATTQRYLHLAGAMFREEGDRVAAQYWGSLPRSADASGTKNRYQMVEETPEQATSR